MGNLFELKYLVTITPQLLLSAGALLILILQLVLPRYRVSVAYYLSITVTLLAALVTAFGLPSGIEQALQQSTGSSQVYPGLFEGRINISAFHNHVLVNNFSSLYVFAILVSLLFILTMGRRLLRELNLELAEIYQMILFTAAGLTFLVIAQDLIMLFVALELASLPLFVMAGWDRKSRSSNEAGMKYFILSVFASAFLLLGIAFLYGATGETALYPIASHLSSHNPNSLAALTMPIAGWGLVLTGLAFKVALFPFHGWVADVYEGSITVVTALMAALVKIASVAVFFKIVVYISPEMRMVLLPAIGFFVIASMFYGNFAALKQTNLKRMFAFSSIAHAGYMGSMFYLPVFHRGEITIQNEAAAALFFYVISYAAASILAFLAIAYLETSSEDKKPVEIDDLKGLSKRNPLAAFVLTLAALSFAGIPPLIGFYGKFYLLRVLFRESNIVMAVMVAINSLIAVYYYARVMFYSYWDFDDEKETLSNGLFRGLPAWVPAAILVIIIIAVGIISGPYFQNIINATREIR